MSYRQQMVDDSPCFMQSASPRLSQVDCRFLSLTDRGEVHRGDAQVIQVGAQIGMKYSRKALEDEAAHKP